MFSPHLIACCFQNLYVPMTYVYEALNIRNTGSLALKDVQKCHAVFNRLKQLNWRTLTDDTTVTR